MLKEINGDLLDTDVQYIVHQTNCVSSKAAGLAYDIFNKFPYSNVYAQRENQAGELDIPGEIIICGNGNDQRYIINLMGQFYPGGPGMSNKDDAKTRHKYFNNGLWRIASIPNLKSVAFPFCIGCGIAGGSWDIYHRMISKFANYISDKADVFIITKI